MWQDIATWEALTVDGRGIPQETCDVTMRELVARHGRILTLRLIPKRAGIPAVSVTIPPKAMPVYFRRRHGGIAAGGAWSESAMEFFVGWEIEGCLVVNAVDAQSGRVRMLVECRR